jgi:hypothetical protein
MPANERLKTTPTALSSPIPMTIMDAIKNEPHGIVPDSYRRMITSSMTKPTPKLEPTVQAA